MSHDGAYDLGFRDGLWKMEGQTTALPNKLWKPYLNGYMDGIDARLIGIQSHHMDVMIREIEIYLEEYANGHH